MIGFYEMLSRNLGFFNYISLFVMMVCDISSVANIKFYIGTLMSAIAKIMSVIAFFIPLKIFIVISEREMPSYLAFIPEYSEYPQGLFFLVALLPVSYLFYFFLGVVSRWLIDSHYSTLRASSLTFIAKNKYNEKSIYKIHNRINKQVSELFILCIGVILSLFFEYHLSILLFLLIFFDFIIIFKYSVNSHDSDRVTFLRLHRRQLSEYVTTGSFLVYFFSLAYMAYLDLTGIFVAVFMLLLSRLMFQSVNRFSMESMLLLPILKG